MIELNEGLIVGVLGFIATLASVIALILKSRGENKNAAQNTKASLNSQIDARIESQLKEAWVKIDDLTAKFEAQEARDERRSRAFTRILYAIANQWPEGLGPILDPIDIAEIEETIPTQWIRRRNI